MVGVRKITQADAAIKIYAGISATSIRAYIPIRITLTEIPIERIIAISPLNASTARDEQRWIKNAKNEMVKSQTRKSAINASA